MKTNPIARRLIKIRVVVLCLAIAAMAAAEVRLGDSLAAQCGQATARRNESVPAPNVSLGELMAAAR